MLQIFAVLKAILQVVLQAAGKSLMRIASGTGVNPVEEALSQVLIELSQTYLNMMRSVRDAGV